jgi:hypothetical protein
VHRYLLVHAVRVLDKFTHYGKVKRHQLLLNTLWLQEAVQVAQEVAAQEVEVQADTAAALSVKHLAAAHQQRQH